MIVRIPTHIYVRVENADKAEEAVSIIDQSLDRQMEKFPVGEVVGVETPEGWNEATQAEVEDFGLSWTEEHKSS